MRPVDVSYHLPTYKGIPPLVIGPTPPPAISLLAYLIANIIFGSSSASCCGVNCVASSSVAF